MSALISDFSGSDSTEEEGEGEDDDDNDDDESPVLDDDDNTFQRKLACPLCSLVTRDTVGNFNIYRLGQNYRDTWHFCV